MKLFPIHYHDKHSQFSSKKPVHEQKVSDELARKLSDYGYKSHEELTAEFNTSLESGLSKDKCKRLLAEYGLNEITHEKRKPWIIRLLLTFKNPLIILLLVLVVISLSTGDIPTACIVTTMILISVILRFIQEEQAYNAAEKLRSMVTTTCAVINEGKISEVDVRYVVPGDIVQLAAGDIVPADLRILNSRDLFINQSLLTGEALPVEKHASPPAAKTRNPLELHNLCFMGTNVESGTAQGIILQTGGNTYFGNLAKSIEGQRVETNFDKGVDKFTWLMIWFMLIMTPLVFLINGIGKGDWWEAFLFAISVAVGLTPDMLPAIVAVNLSKGSMVMSQKKVIVKRLSSIQNFGAMNVLCTDKTGTLTANKIALIENINIDGKDDTSIVHFAFLNSFYQTGFRNLLDEAVLHHVKTTHFQTNEKNYQKVDELPFDFKRKRLSIVVQNEKKEKYLICKGAVEEVTQICTQFELHGEKYDLGKKNQEKIHNLNVEKSNQGFRVIAVGYKKITDDRIHYLLKDEKDLIFLGFMTFFDPPKESAAGAIKKLEKFGVAVKVLTGDNELVTRKVCKEVGLPDGESVLLGSQIEQMDDDTLVRKAESTTIFAKLSPDDKKRVVQALQQSHVVGFLGDGINDAPALRTADVGISVDSAVDIAKESADIILLELNLLVLADGVIEGRNVFGNIIKYIRMGASSNFGNMFSMLGASLFLPFLPMAPLQIITNNLLYDISQTAIPTDIVDQEYLEKPRKWDILDIRRFMFFFGPTSSIFDYVTFFVMIFILHAWVKNVSLFQTGWFVESIITQTLIVHVIRSRKIPFIQTWSSSSLFLMTVAIMAIGIYLPFSPLAHSLGFVKLPVLYWPILEGILLSYVILTQLVKVWYARRFGYN